MLRPTHPAARRLAAAATAAGASSPPLLPLPLLLRRRALSTTSTSSSSDNSSSVEKPLLVTHTPVAGGAPGAVIATLAMNRPKARNALSKALVAEVGKMIYVCV